MLTLLRKIFIKNYNDLENGNVRQKHGKLASFVGILSNLLLFALKMIVGLIAGSISIISDSINNLTDMGSSFISLFGFYISGKPADADHPYGHERFEYISGLVVSIVIIVVGVQFLFESATKFYNALFQGTNEKYSSFVIVILIASILIKLWQGLFNKKIGKLINSVSLEATAKDSLNDAISTSVILLSVVISMIFPEIKIGSYYISIDGAMGFIVSIMIIISAIKLIKETIDPLLGVPADKEYVSKIVNSIKKHECVLGVHDVICHMYGPTTCFMTVHVEVDGQMDINDAHTKIDLIEKEIKDLYKIEIVIHMDPIDTKSEDIIRYKEELTTIISNISEQLNFHDVRLVKNELLTNVIFDCVVPFKFKYKEEEIKQMIQDELSLIEENTFVIINFDREFVAGRR